MKNITKGRNFFMKTEKLKSSKMCGICHSQRATAIEESCKSNRFFADAQNDMLSHVTLRKAEGAHYVFEILRLRLRMTEGFYIIMSFRTNSKESLNFDL